MSSPPNSNRNDNPVSHGSETTREPTREDYVDEPVRDFHYSASDVNSKTNSEKSSPTREPSTLSAYRISAHRLRWEFSLRSHRPQRSPTREYAMRNWPEPKRIWHINERTTIVANLSGLELWLDVGKAENTEACLTRAWEEAKRIMTEFCEWQRIAVSLDISARPKNLKAAHIVLEEKKPYGPVYQALKPHMSLPEHPNPGSVLTGLRTDKSDRGKAEMDGQYSAEGGGGFDELVLKGPGRLRHIVHILQRHGEAIELLQAQNAALLKGQTAIMEAMVIRK